MDIRDLREVQPLVDLFWAQWWPDYVWGYSKHDYDEYRYTRLVAGELHAGSRRLEHGEMDGSIAWLHEDGSIEYFKRGTDFYDFKSNGTRWVRREKPLPDDWPHS